MNRAAYLLPAALVVAALQIGLLFSIIASRAAILRDGTEIMLKVEPIDPRDLLRGDYVRLGYGISTVPRALFQPLLTDADVVEGRGVVVRLARGSDGFWVPTGASLADAAAIGATSGEVDIAGRMEGAWSSDTDSIRVDYGIERFYLPEGEGREIEQDMRERSFSMLVAVGGDGRAQIKAFFDGEKRLYDEPLY